MLHRHTPLLIAAALMLAPCLSHAAEAAKPKPSFMPIPGLAATIVRAGGGHGVMTVEAGLDIPDPALRTLADQDEPRLRDAFAVVLQAFAGSLPPGAVPDLDYLSARLQAAADRTLGKPGAHILFGGVMVN